ncbi:MAG TPA: rhomboid family intramembrane serine protease [Xanthobacteraceae bacterium]|nr:rhomboid family intramembrane serine protease [Xanthobacteraceae bacterium]
MSARSEPVFNVPRVIAALLAVLILVHAVREFLLSDDENIEVVLLFAFIPVRYDPSVLAMGSLPGGFAAQVWSFVTYALIHGDVVHPGVDGLAHLGINGVWLLAFGSPIARRFGTLRFLVFFAVTAAAGAAAHLATHLGDLHPVVGASAAISGCMAASMRFAFQRGGPLHLLRESDEAAYRVPAAPLRSALRDRRILVFLVAWFGVNALFGVTAAPIIGASQAIAWQAHIGGFLAGLIAFAAFDPVARSAAAAGDAGSPDAPA